MNPWSLTSFHSQGRRASTSAAVVIVATVRFVVLLVSGSQTVQALCYALIIKEPHRRIDEHRAPLPEALFRCMVGPKEEGREKRRSEERLTEAEPLFSLLPQGLRWDRPRWRRLLGMYRSKGHPISRSA